MLLVCNINWLLYNIAIWHGIHGRCDNPSTFLIQNVELRFRIKKRLHLTTLLFWIYCQVTS